MIEYFQRLNCAVSPPEHQAGLLGIGVNGQSVGDDLRAWPLRLKIQAGAAAIGGTHNAQGFNRGLPVSRGIPNRGMFEQPANDGGLDP